MSAVAKLNKNIDKARSMVDNYKTLIVDEPENIAYQLTLGSLENHLSDLQGQLRRELEAREKEIVELRLKGNLAQNGTIPLSILADIAKYVSGAIYTSSQRIRKGKDPRGRIPNEVINTLDLRLAGISHGSTKLLLTGNTSPDLFGYSLLEDSLEKTFELLNSENTEQIAESITKIGPASVRRINAFLKTLINHNLEIDLTWSSPALEPHKWEGDNQKIQMMSNTFESITTSRPEMLNVVGELIMASLKGQFEVESIDGSTYRGIFPADLLPKIKELHVGDKVTCNIEKETILNNITNYKKISFMLIDIESKN